MAARIPGQVESLVRSAEWPSWPSVQEYLVTCPVSIAQNRALQRPHGEAGMATNRGRFLLALVALESKIEMHLVLTSHG